MFFRMLTAAATLTISESTEELKISRIKTDFLTTGPRFVATDDCVGTLVTPPRSKDPILIKLKEGTEGIQDPTKPYTTGDDMRWLYVMITVSSRVKPKLEGGTLRLPANSPFSVPRQKGESATLRKGTAIAVKKSIGGAAGSIDIQISLRFPADCFKESSMESAATLRSLTLGTPILEGSGSRIKTNFMSTGHYFVAQEECVGFLEIEEKKSGHLRMTRQYPISLRTGTVGIQDSKTPYYPGHRQRMLYVMLPVTVAPDQTPEATLFERGNKRLPYDLNVIVTLQNGDRMILPLKKDLHAVAVSEQDDLRIQISLMFQAGYCMRPWNEPVKFVGSFPPGF